MRVQLFLILAMLGVSFTAGAQLPAPGKDTVMKSATIEVIQAYKPQVKQAPKPEWVPQLPPPDTTHTAVNYDDVPQQSLYFTYTSLPLHPLALGKDVLPLPFQDYIKLGAGNLNTIFLDAGIGAVHGKDYETYIHLHHLSQKGDITNQQTALSGIEAEGLLHKDYSDWHASISGERNQYYYYGYNHDYYSYSSDSVKQTYTTIRATVDMKNKDASSQFSYHPEISASLYNAAMNTSETNFGFDVPLAYKFDNSLQAQVALTGAVTNLQANSISTNNNYVELLPGFSFDNNVFKGHALLGLAAGKDGKNYILPDILAAYTLPGTGSTIFAGIQSTLRQNTYEQLTTENPYIFNNYQVMQTSKAEYFAGVQGGAGDHFTYSARISYWDYQELPTFLNDSGDQKQFRIVYDDNVNALSFQLAARYKVANNWSAGLTGDIYHFNNGTQPYVWGEPGTKIKGDFSFMPSPKFTVTAYLALMGGIWAKDSFGNTIKLNTFTDLGGNAEYQIVPRISVFLQVNNILNDKYQRWLGYQAYGINIYGGLRLKF